MLKNLLSSVVLQTPLLGLILAPFVTALVDAIKNGWAWLDRQSPIVKQSAAIILSCVLVGLAHLIPGSVPDACANVAAGGISDACEQALASGPFVQMVVAALGSIVFKHGQQIAQG
jgi:hypothetical protein